jgi:hypothetical protein
MALHVYVYYRVDAARRDQATAEARAWLALAQARGACRQARLYRRDDAVAAAGSCTLMEVYDSVDEQRFAALPLQNMGPVLANLKRIEERFIDA